MSQTTHISAVGNMQKPEICMCACMFYVDQPFLAGCNAVVCDKCFRRNFSELAYQYRQDIPEIELPGYLLVYEKSFY